MSPGEHSAHAQREAQAQAGLGVVQADAEHLLNDGQAVPERVVVDEQRLCSLCAVAAARQEGIQRTEQIRRVGVIVGRQRAERTVAERRQLTVRAACQQPVQPQVFKQ